MVGLPMMKFLDPPHVRLDTACKPVHPVSDVCGKTGHRKRYIGFEPAVGIRPHNMALPPAGPPKQHPSPGTRERQALKASRDPTQGGGALNSDCLSAARALMRASILHLLTVFLHI